MVYEQSVVVSLPLTFTKEGEGQSLNATVGYQACSDTGCFAPQTVSLQLPIKTANLVEWPPRK
jgi:DsbC/DsbD-like thiol-disulfide interchange protein